MWPQQAGVNGVVNNSNSATGTATGDWSQNTALNTTAIPRLPPQQPSQQQQDSTGTAQWNANASLQPALIGSGGPSVLAGGNWCQPASGVPPPNCDTVFFKKID